LFAPIVSTPGVPNVPAVPHTDVPVPVEPEFIDFNSHKNNNHAYQKQLLSILSTYHFVLDSG
jgi:hypothetical protein